MKYIDVHAHLGEKRFDEDRDEVVKRAEKNNVSIVCSGVNPFENRKVLKYSKKYNNVYAAFGIYPIDALKKNFPDLEDDSPRENLIPFSIDDELKWIEEHKDDCVMVGEIGMDFKVIDVNEEIKKIQAENFEKIIEFAKKINKPILIHSRGAESECIEILEKHNCKNVIMHCFNGKKSLIKKIVENGWLLSIPAVITRLQHFKMVVDIIPLEQMVLETDAPYLSPVYGTRNESSNILITVKEISKIKNINEKDVQKQLLENTEKILKI